MRQIKIEDYVSFAKSTKPAQMIIEDVLETGSLTLVHSGPGVGKTGLGFDMAASIITGRDWLGRFKIQTKDAYVFFISQDAPRQDVLQQSWKVFRRYFDAHNRADARLLRARFHVIDQNNIKLDAKNDEDVDALIAAIQSRMEAAVDDARLADLLRETGATGDDWRQVLEDWRERRDAEEAAAAAERAYEEEARAESGDEQSPDEDMPAPDVQPVAKSGPVIVIFWDVMRRFHNGKESQSDELAPFFEGVRKINNALGASSIVYHHDNRRGAYKGDTTVVGSVDVGYQLEPANGDDPTAPVRTISFGITKPRGIQCRPFVYRMVREGIKTREESLRYEFIREGQSATEGRKAAPKPVKIDPRESAARRLYRPEMSVKALAEALRAEGFKIGYDKLKSIVANLKAESKPTAEAEAEKTG